MPDNDLTPAEQAAKHVPETFRKAEPELAAKLEAAIAGRLSDKAVAKADTGSEPEKNKKLNSKDTNPKDAVGGTKARWMSVIPLRVLYGIGLAMYEGARKYGRHNYRIAGVRASVYADAASGHIQDWMEGQDIDPDSGLSHIDKAIASLVVLRDGMYSGNWTDDRPPSIANIDKFKAEMNAKWQAITAKYPDPAPAYTIHDTVEGK